MPMNSFLGRFAPVELDSKTAFFLYEISEVWWAGFKSLVSYGCLLSGSANINK